MSFSFGHSGGVQDPKILRLLAELTTLVKTNNSDGRGASSPEVLDFIEKNKNVFFVDELSGCMHTFKEVAEALSPLIQGLRNPDPDKKFPGDSWQNGGQVEDMFNEKNPDEPADWWKS